MIDDNEEEIILCRRCHRKLKDEESKKLGFGKICYQKYKKRNHNYLFDIPKGDEENGTNNI